jgi:hypothetical protein
MGTRQTRAIGISAFFSALLLAITVVRADSILWVSGGDGKLWRSNLDGGGAEALVEISPYPRSHEGGIAVHDGKIYWGTDGSYHWANLDGTQQEPVATVPEVVRIKLLKGVMDNAGNTYFPREESSADGDGEEHGGIRFTPPAGVAIDNIRGKLYWAGGWNQFDSGLMQRSNLDGSGVETIYTGEDLHFEDYPIDIEIDPVAGMIYWTGNMSWIARAPLDGGVPPQIIHMRDGASIETMALEITVPEPSAFLLLLLPMEMLRRRRVR